MSVGSAGRVRPTKGELLNLERRLKILQGGLEVLTMKKDQLHKKLQGDINDIINRRTRLECGLLEAYKALISAYMAVGSSQIEMQATSIRGMLRVKVLPKSIMGITVPKIEVLSKPSFEEKLGTIECGVADKFRDLIDDLLNVTENEDEAVKIAYELEKTNRKVNALEKITVPNLRREIKYVDEMLEEEDLEEFTRIKLLRDIVVRRRS